MTAASTSAKLKLIENTLFITGTVDPLGVTELRSKGEALLAQVQGTVVVDLAGLNSANSALLSVLLCWQRFAAERSLHLVFQSPGERLLGLAALANLDTTLLGFQAPEGGVHPA